MQFEDEVRFIQRYADEIAPTVENTDALRVIQNLDAETLGKRAEILDGFSTHLYCHEKPEFEGMTVMVTADNPGAWGAMGPIVAQLLTDSRCGTIFVMVSGVARAAFEGDFGKQFYRISARNGSLFEELLFQAANFSFDVIIASVSSANGPETVALYAGKSSLRAKKLFYVVEGWTGLGNAFSENRVRMDPIDGFFSNDELAKQIILHTLPEFPPEQLFTTGTPVLDGLMPEKGEELRKQGRAKLSLAEDVFAVSYLGDISADYESGLYADLKLNPSVSEVTFEDTVGAFIVFAKEHEIRQFALLLRPHPRDPRKQELYQTMENMKELCPPNLRFVRAAYPEVSSHETVYASDVVTSIVSTENFFAPLRGRKSIFLGYREKDLGGALLERIFGRDILGVIASDPCVRVAGSTHDFTEHLGDFLQVKAAPLERQLPPGSSAERILDIVLA